jgi:hypothetical protein
LSKRTGIWLAVLLTVAVVLFGLVVCWREAMRPTDIATQALVTAGYTDFGMTNARVSRCSGSQSTIAYWARNRNTGAKAAGYICIRRSGEATFAEGPLDPGEHLTQPGV